ncbi:salicylic acid-binding protein 2-like protein [Tanacetum coccineum]
MGSDSDEQKHFVLVHGSCHGSLFGFKLIPLLEAMGHRVSAFDLLASGTNTKVIQQVYTLSDYTMPLLEFMATLLPEEKVVLVGHSFGGMSISLAMEKFPEKISLAVFLSAYMPDYVHEPSFVLNKFSPYGSENESETSILFGPKFLASNLYQLCSKEDLELAKILVRPSSLFLNDLDKEQPFSEKRLRKADNQRDPCILDDLVIAMLRRREGLNIGSLQKWVGGYFSQSFGLGNQSLSLGQGRRFSISKVIGFKGIWAIHVGSPPIFFFGKIEKSLFAVYGYSASVVLLACNVESVNHVFGGDATMLPDTVGRFVFRWCDSPLFSSSCAILSMFGSCLDASKE